MMHLRAEAAHVLIRDNIKNLIYCIFCIHLLSLKAPWGPIYYLWDPRGSQGFMSLFIFNCHAHHGVWGPLVSHGTPGWVEKYMFYLDTKG